MISNAEFQRRIRELARKYYQEDGKIEIDDFAVVSKSNGGAYVQAWIWVDYPEPTGDSK